MIKVIRNQIPTDGRGRQLAGGSGILENMRKSLAHLTRILGREGANPRVSGIFFKVIVQVVLILGSETWVLTPCMEQALGNCQHRVVRRITGNHLKRREEGCWDYPPLVTAMEEAIFEEIGV